MSDQHQTEPQAKRPRQRTTTAEVEITQLTPEQLAREQVRCARETLKCLRELIESVGTIEATALTLANVLHDKQHGAPPCPVDRDTMNLKVVP